MVPRRAATTLVLAVWLLATPACVSSSRGVSMPPASAPPMAVLRTYLSALNTHNVRLARALLDPNWRALMGARWDEMAANDRRIGNVQLQLAAPAATAWDPRTKVGYVDRYDLQVNFDLQVYDPNATDRRPHAYGYTLIRANPTAPWRLAGEGLLQA